MIPLSRTLMLIYLCGCLGGTLAGCDGGQPESPDSSVLGDLGEIKDRCADDLLAYSNAYIIERLYHAGKSKASRPTAIDCQLRRLPDRSALVVYGYNPCGDTDSYSVFFFSRNGQVCEVVEGVSDIGLEREIDKFSAIVEEVPLAEFDGCSSGPIINKGRVLKIPRGTPLAVAFHTKAGLMSNAVGVREKVFPPSTAPTSQK